MFLHVSFKDQLLEVGHNLYSIYAYKLKKKKKKKMQY